jgi:hypothetical protein
MQKAAGLDEELAISAGEAPRLQLAIRLRQHADDACGRNIECGHPRFIQRHADLASLPADDLHFGNVGNLFDLIV